jgi:hypothetical protein
MSYEQKFAFVRQSLISHCKECIVENFNQMFEMWLMCEADMAFGDGYINIFKQHFGDYITDQVRAQLWCDAKNIIYAINSFLYIKKGNSKLDDLVKFVEKFVSEQLDDFSNNYETCEWFNDEGEYIQETREDNPN